MGDGGMIAVFVALFTLVGGIIIGLTQSGDLGWIALIIVGLFPATFLIGLFGGAWIIRICFTESEEEAEKKLEARIKREYGIDKLEEQLRQQGFMYFTINIDHGRLCTNY